MIANPLLAVGVSFDSDHVIGSYCLLFESSRLPIFSLFVFRKQQASWDLRQHLSRQSGQTQNISVNIYAGHLKG